MMHREHDDAPNFKKDWPQMLKLTFIVAAAVAVLIFVA